MEYRLRLQATTFDKEGKLSALGDMRIVGTAAFIGLNERIRALVEQVFTVQGYPEWAPLAASTVFERLMLGFAEGPILVRTGRLMASYVDPDSPDAHTGVWRTRDRTYIAVGSGDPRAKALAEGDPATNLPARPPFPDGTILFPAIFEELVTAEEVMFG